MRVACLSGWGQPHDALESCVPDNAVATHIDFARHDSVNAAILKIAEQARGAEIVVGWSLGGQMALRAIASGMLQPSKLVLIATPFQFVKSASLPIGMPADLFAKFSENYAKNPENTLKKAWDLMAKDDTKAENIQKHIKKNDKKAVMARNWGSWLQILENYTCKDLQTADMPATLLIHGDRDLVVFHEQSEQMIGILPKARLETIEGSGHAPHWHDPARIKTLIAAHAHV